MAMKIKIRCNGPEKCVNEIDVKEYLKPRPVLRGAAPDTEPRIPEKLVFPCRHCSEGKVIATRSMMEDCGLRAASSG